jgi:Flp pilus assembly protein TadB
MVGVSWLFIALLAAAVVVLIAAEWPRLAGRAGSRARQSRARARQKAQLRLLKTESDEFAASVQRDLERLPTIEEHDPSR